MTERPLHVAGDGTIAPMDDAQFAQWQADQAAAQTLPPMLPDLSPTQLALGLRREGIIVSLEDTISFAAAGKIPAELLALLDVIADQQQREDAIVRVAAATVYEWANPITQLIGANVGGALGWSDDDFRAKWLAWSQL